MKSIILDASPTIISLLAIIIFYKKLQPRWLRLFLYFLLITLATDIGAGLYSQYFQKSNHFIINMYLPVNFCFYLLLFILTFEKRSYKNLVWMLLALFLVFYFSDILFLEGFYTFNIYSFCVGSILIVLCCLLYFTVLFTSEKVINYFASPPFWIATGLIFFYVGNLVQISLMNYIINNQLDPGGRIYELISIILNVILYGCITISFICNYPWRKAR